MRKRFFKFLGIEDRFKREFRKQMRMLITVTFGFTIAFTWRQTIFDFFEWLVSFVTNIPKTPTTSFIASILITLFSVFFIYLTSWLLKEDY